MARPESPPKTPFGRRLRQLRKKYGVDLQKDEFTAKDFAVELGVEDETYRSYERGESEPPFWVLVKIKKETGASLDWLIFGAQNEPKMQSQAPETPRHLRRA